jgi:hypothetical protein
MQRKITTVSNHKAREAALRYCRESIEKLQEMKLQPEVSQDELKELAQGLPDPTMDFSRDPGPEAGKRRGTFATVGKH